MTRKALSLDVQRELERLVRLESSAPHSLLGIHERVGGGRTIRLWRPGAPYAHLEVNGEKIEAHRVEEAGLFECQVGSDVDFSRYRVFLDSGNLVHDPYAFLPSLGETDLYLFNKGVHYQLHRIMGARFIRHQGIEGVRFAVWAPNAKRVSLVGDFNGWNGRATPMRVLGESGVWELFVPGLWEGMSYKYEILTQEGQLYLKSDPYALFHEVRPKTASVLARVDDYPWTDQEWQASSRREPMVIYEVHLGSWRRRHHEFLNYREIGVQLAKYCAEMGFTHVELLPITEHPLDESWGYQTTGYFAPTSRFGSPRDFQFMVNYLHCHGIGVILDWVPGHFPMDGFSLRRFDGTALYEHEDMRQGIHPHWHTCIFNFGRHEVSNFLLASALFWLEVMHLDGLRVDAVASMLYLDYGRDQGQWLPNRYGGKENLDALEFLRHLNSVVHERVPSAYMIAEESTSFPGITRGLNEGGLGFDLKWNMGWMNDTLRYFREDPLYRTYHHNLLTFGLLYAFTERFLLPLSHDEVVHGKASLLSKMPGDPWQKMAGLRLLYSYMMCQPGKKLWFMGGELGQWNEWNCTRELEWELLRFPSHHGIQRLVAALNHFYLSQPALWERDHDWNGFEWLVLDDTRNSVLAYLRKSAHECLVCVHNFTSQYHGHYRLPLPGLRSLTELFNSDDRAFGGSGKLNTAPHLDDRGATIQTPPLATCVFKLESLS